MKNPGRGWGKGSQIQGRDGKVSGTGVKWCENVARFLLYRDS